MTCGDCIHWTEQCWQHPDGTWCTYGSKRLAGGELVAKGRCDQMPAEHDDKWSDDIACFLFESRERQQNLFGG